MSKNKFEPKVLKLSPEAQARLEKDIERKQGIRKDIQQKKLTIEEIEAKWDVRFYRGLPYE